MRIGLGAITLAVLVTAGAASADEAGRGDIRAQLAPRRYTTLSAELGAKIERIAVREGERFKDGQMLVALDCSVQRANLEKARAALVGAERTSTVNKTLHDMNAGGALEADVSAAEALKAKADVNASAAIVSKCVVSAPFSGRVADLKVREQQFVQPGTAMLEIIDDSVLEVEFLAPSKWLAWLKPGAAFQIAVDETGRSYPVKLARLGARVDPVSQSIKVVGEITGAFPELLAGMSGKVLLAPP